nr:hypothetical protein [Tanacetum cinerariifolium]
ISILEHDIGLGGPLQHVEKIDLKEKSSGSIKSPTKRTLDILYGQAVRSLEKGDSPRLLSYPLNEPPLKLPAEPPHKKCAFRTSVPGSDSALAADIMSAPEDDSFEIDDALAVDIVATSTLSGVSLTPALVENNKQIFPEVVKVLEQADPKALELTSNVCWKGLREVFEEEIASPIELEKAYMASRPYKALKRRISILEHDIGLGGPLQHVEKMDLKEKNDALAADIVATSTLSGVSLTPALVENNKQMFPE